MRSMADRDAAALDQRIPTFAGTTSGSGPLNDGM